MYLCPCHVPVLVPVPAPFPVLVPAHVPVSASVPTLFQNPHPSPSLTYWGQGLVCVWFGIPFLSDFGTFLLTVLSILGVWVPKGARVPKRVKNGHTKPKESSPKLEAFLTYFRTCRAQFFHQLFGPFLRRSVDHFWCPGAPKWAPFWDVFGDCLGQG